MDDGYTQLQRLLVFNSWRTGDTARSLRSARRRRRCGADEVRCIDLDLVAPFRTHLTQSELRILQQDGILYVTEANGDTRSVSHSMRAHAENVGLECPSGSTHDEVEPVLGVNGKSRQFGRGICKRRRYSSETLVVAIDIEGT